MLSRGRKCLEKDLSGPSESASAIFQVFVRPEGIVFGHGGLDLKAKPPQGFAKLGLAAPELFDVAVDTRSFEIHVRKLGTKKLQAFPKPFDRFGRFDQLGLTERAVR
jgi:hypothetical protein